MKNRSELVAVVSKTLRDNSTGILTAMSITGTLSTVYLASTASFKAARTIDLNESIGGTASDRKQRVKERTKLVWKLYIPTALTTASTVTCIVAATKIQNRKAAALTAAYTISEKAFNEYAEKVTEKLGEKKEQALRDEIAQDKVNRNPPQAKELIVAGSGNVLCCELYTGRYFYSDMETLRRAANDINARVLSEMYAVLSDFYCLVGLGYTSTSDDMGWDTDRQLSLKFTAVLTDDSRPCIAFDYNYVKPMR